MSNLQVFKSSEFGELSVLVIDGKEYFPASECAIKLGYANPHKAIGDHCKGVTKREVLTEGGPQSMNFIPEGDLYRLIARSKLPAAERFERWIFDEVLPDIRKHGGYLTPQLPGVSPELQMFKLLYDGMVNQEVKVNALEEKVTALEENAVQNLQIPSLPASKLEIQAMEHVMKKDRLSTTQIAARFGLSAVAFYRLLNTLGFVVPINSAKGWELSPEYIGKGVGTSDISISGDTMYGYVSWTPKGRELIEETLKFNGIKPIKRLAPKKKHKKRK